MNVDRSLFLAFAATLAGAAAVGCSSEDSGTSGDTQEVNANHDYCWTPATESASGPGRDWYVQQIGFDPAADYPAAEGFCLSLAFPNDLNPDGPEYQSEVGVFEKCQSYAKNYVPMTTFDAFLTMKRIDAESTTAIEKFSRLYELDRSIARDNLVCKTQEATRMCRGNPECTTIASQFRPERLPLLKQCIGGGFDAYSCIEGGDELR